MPDERELSRHKAYYSGPLMVVRFPQDELRRSFQTGELFLPPEVYVTWYDLKNARAKVEKITWEAAAATRPDDMRAIGREMARDRQLETQARVEAIKAKS